MNILAKLKETAISVLPVMAIVLFLGFTFVPLDKHLLARFVVGGLFLIIGLTIFLLGVDLGIQPMGERCGAELTKKRSLSLLLIVAFVIGFIVTAAEPDIQVFGDQVRSLFPFVNKLSITFVIAGGVGLFITLGLLRTVLNLSLKWTFFISYTLLFALSFFAPESFIGIAFDSGGATTGPMTVPFIMALGLGVSSVRDDDDNSFGLTGVCSIGPVMAVLIYAIILKKMVLSTGSASQLAEAAVSGTVGFLAVAGHVFREALISIAPLFALSIFLIGWNGCFSQAGAALGQKLGELAVSRGGAWYLLLIGTGLLLGAIIVCAEPAVWILSEQVEQVSGGTIKRRVLLIFLSVGTAVAIGLSMWRAVAGFNLKYILIPGYILAMLLMIFCPPLFSGIAFDSGGVASGPLTSTFVLSFTLGAAASGKGGNDSFGVIALVAMLPLLAIQLMGIIFKLKQRKSNDKSVQEVSDGV